MHEVWFAIPSASVDRCRSRLPAWRDMGYRVAILQNHERGDIPADRVVWSDEYPGWAESVNVLCREIVPASADLVVSGGDDMLPDPKRDAQTLAREYFERFPDGFGVMQPAGDDYLWGRNYCGSPWFARPFFSRMYGGRGPMYGGDRHNWADYELYWVARGLGALWMREDAEQRHEHFTREGEEAPAWWTKNVSDADERDCSLFLARKYRDFPGHEPTGGGPTYNPSDLLRHEQGVAEWRWNRSYAPHSIATAAAERMEQALNACAAEGRSRVAIYGGGSHTRRVAHALAEPPVTIVAVVDDDARRHGGTLWGYPIVSLERARELGIDALVISSDAHEPAMYERCASLETQGVTVVRLYADENEEAPR